MKFTYFRFILICLLFLTQLGTFAQNTLDKVGLTSSTPARYAYSLRRLSTSFVGPLVRITDGVNYYDVYPDANTSILSLNSKISSPIAYSAAITGASSNALSSIITDGATNLNVATWYDQSGYAIHVTTASTNGPRLVVAGKLKYLNGVPSLYFAGTTGNSEGFRSTATVNLTALTSGTYSTVIQNIASNGTSGISGIINAGDGGAWGMGYGSASPFFGYYVDGAGCINAITGEASTDPKLLTTFINNNVSSHIYDFGSLKASKATFCTFTSTSTDQINIGTRSGGTRKFDGNIAEIIFFPKSISATEQSTLEANQKNIYFEPSVSIASSKSNNTLCAGESVTFTATPYNATNPTYQWKKNGASISGETAATYTTTSIADNDVITVEMYQNSASLTSTIVSDNTLLLKLDATDPLSYPGTGTTWADLSGMNNHATLNSHQSYDGGGSIQFDGTNNPVVMPLVTNSINNVSMQCWVYLDASTVGPFMKNGSNGGYSFGTGAGGNGFGLGNKATMLLNAVAWQPLGVVMGYGWKLVTMTISGTTESMYVNDIFVGSRTGTPAVPANGTYLGTTVNDNSGANYFNSKMAAAFIYGKALTTSEIAQNYRAGRFKLSPLTALSNSLTMRANGAATATLSSATGTDAQTACINTSITSITYNTSGASGVSFGGLPAGVTGSYANNVVTISGSPSVSGNFTYSVNLTSSCGNVTVLSGLLTIKSTNTLNLLSTASTSNQTVCNGLTLVPISYVSTGVTGASFSGLPSGVAGVWANDTLTISGSPSESGTFNFTVTLTGGCGTISSSGTIVSSANNAATLSSALGSNAQSVCVNSAISPISYSTTGATGATFSGLPAGVIGSWNTNSIVISGTPTLAGSYSYTVTLTGGCGSVSLSGTIQVLQNSISLSSSTGTDAQSICNKSQITAITYATVGATGASFTGLPPGVTGTWVGNVVTISGTPTATGAYSYTVTLTGGCGVVSISGSITVVSSAVSIVSDVSSSPICYGTPVTFTASVTNPGTNGTYQWYKNGLSISGETNSTFTTNTLNHSDAVYVSYASTCTSGEGVNTNGLLQYLEASNPISYAGSGTTWYDLSGNNNHGTLNSAVFTNLGGVKYFSLASTYISAPLPKTTSMTFSTWAKTSNPQAVMLFNAGNAGSGPDVFFYNGRIFWNIWNSEASPFGTVSTSIIDAEFHQYTIVVDAVTNDAKLYFDGVFKGAATYWSPTRSSPTALYIGGAGPGDNWNWQGGIRNFQSYNRALSAEEVRANYAATGGNGATNSNTISTSVSKITLKSAAGTNAQTKCISTVLTNIEYEATGASGANVSGLPTGVNWSWSNGTITISGTPSVAGTYTYTISLTGGCSGDVSATGTLIVNPKNTIALTSAVGTNAQSTCLNSAITNISYASTSATGASFSGLPNGVTGSWANQVVTISGVPTVSGTFNYTVTLTGGCGPVSATGSIVVRPQNTLVLSSGAGTNAQTICINSALTTITYTTTGATSATFTGLPAGISGVWSNNVVTISGTASLSGSYTYTVSLDGGCGTTSLSGTILVKATNVIALSSALNSDAQRICKNANIVSISYTTSGATGVTFVGLPAGITGTYASNVATISGAASVFGTYPYTVTATGGCGVVEAVGSITVIELPTVNVAVSGNNCAQKSTMTATDGFVSYAWYKDNVVIGGATLRSYAPAIKGTFKVIVSDGTCSNTSASVVFYDCGMTAEGNIVPTTSTLLVNNAGGTNNGTGITDEGKVLNITATTTIDVIETAASGATLVLNLDARNVNSLARTTTPGTWYDLSGNQNDATIYGTVAYGSGNGGALNFPGGNANYVQAKSGVYFNGGSFTIQSWVYPMQLYNWNRIIDFGNGAGSNNILLSNTYGTSGNPGLYVEGAQFQSSKNLTLNAWHHVCATFDTNTRIATIYVDGLAAGSATVPRPVNVVRNNCYIGRSNWGFGDPNFAGGMGALQIYNGFLSAAEILSNYNTTKGLYGL